MSINERDESGWNSEFCISLVTDVLIQLCPSQACGLLDTSGACQRTRALVAGRQLGFGIRRSPLRLKCSSLAERCYPVEPLMRPVSRSEGSIERLKLVERFTTRRRSQY